MKKNKKALVILTVLLVILAAYAGFISYLHFWQPTVYISAYGEYYHSDPYCSNMGNTIEVTVEEAEHLYKTPCQICMEQ